MSGCLLADIHMCVFCSHYEDDFEPEEEDMFHEANNPSSMNQRPRPSSPEEDIYDFSPRDLGY